MLAAPTPMNRLREPRTRSGSAAISASVCARVVAGEPVGQGAEVVVDVDRRASGAAGLLLLVGSRSGRAR